MTVRKKSSSECRLKFVFSRRMEIKFTEIWLSRKEAIIESLRYLNEKIKKGRQFCSNAPFCKVSIF